MCNGILTKCTLHTGPLSTIYLLHLAFPSFRVLLLVPLLFALVFPRIAYVPVEAQDEETPTDTSLLLPAQDAAAPSAGLSLSAEASKYGTFRSDRAPAPASGITTRTNTPAPSTVRLPPPKAQVSAWRLLACMRSCSCRRRPTAPAWSNVDHQEAKEDIALDPSWGEIFGRIRHIAPYLWPSKSFGLQLLAVRTPRSRSCDPRG